MIPEKLLKPIDAVVPDTLTHVGFILGNNNGEVSVFCPPAKHGPITATWPRVRLQDELPSAALARCLYEQLGAEAESVYPLPGIWTTANSSTKFFAGLVQSHGDAPLPEDKPVRWVPFNEAAPAFQVSPDAARRARDLAVMAELGEAVWLHSLSPHRRVLQALGELHMLGFHRLRAFTGLSPSGGSWRCSVLPSTCAEPGPGVCVDQEVVQRFNQLIGGDFGTYTYFSEQAQEPFGWQDACFDTPRQLAQKFIDRLPRVALAGWGPDTPYVEWLRGVLERLQPNGLFFAYADWSLPEDSLPTRATNKTPHVHLPAYNEEIPSGSICIWDDAPEPDSLMEAHYRPAGLTSQDRCLNCTCFESDPTELDGRRRCGRFYEAVLPHMVCDVFEKQLGA